jgi:predicted hotdog family 3-hydroxylacyl-ACP dehydratase
MSVWPPPAEVLPHRPPMVLVDRIVGHDATHTVCAVDVRESTPFVTDGGQVPAWIGLEYMAQCVAAHAGLEARARGERIRLGLLIGARTVAFHTDALAIGDSVLITAVRTWGDRALGAFACTIADARSDRRLADAVLSVYSPPDGVPARFVS